MVNDRCLEMKDERCNLSGDTGGRGGRLERRLERYARGQNFAWPRDGIKSTWWMVAGVDGGGVKARKPHDLQKMRYRRRSVRRHKDFFR